MRLGVLTLLAMAAFAGNSIFARLALLPDASGQPPIDATSYTLIRLMSAAIVLGLLTLQKTRSVKMLYQGNIYAASALFCYALAFSYAYIALDTGIGALILFFCVQITMIAWSLIKGHRPKAQEWLGLFVAFTAFIVLVLPRGAFSNTSAPDISASIIMAVAGIAWGVYSLLGKTARHSPLIATTGNFIRTLPMAGIMALGVFLISDIKLAPFGIAMATASGAVTSGLGYALWYACLKHLTPSNAAIIQLSVPAIAAFGGVALLGEQLTLHLGLCAAFILGGVALALSAKRAKPAHDESSP